MQEQTPARHPWSARWFSLSLPGLPEGRTLLAVGVTVVTWASAFPAIRVALDAYSPAHVALLRYIVASLLLLGYALFTQMPLPARRDLPGLFLVGAVGIAFYNIALGYGQTVVPAGTASLLIGSAPIWMALLGVTLFQERLRPLAWLGIAISFVGVFLITLGRGVGLALEPHALIILAAALAQSLYSLGQRRYSSRYSALQATSYAVWTGTLCLLPFLPGLVPSVQAAPASSTLALLYLGLFPGAIGYLTWSYALSRLPAATAGSFLYLVPALALLFAWLTLGEVPALLSVVGGILVLTGVILVNRRPR